MEPSFKSYCFDDVLMRPLHSTVKSRANIHLDVNIASGHRSLRLKVPLISSPMDTVTDENMAIQLALNGCLGIIHRYMTVAEQVGHVANVKRYVNYIFREPYKIPCYATCNDARELCAKTGVSTLCVMSTTTGDICGVGIGPNQFIGLITKRDLQSQDASTPIAQLMTIVKNLHKIVIRNIDIVDNPVELHKLMMDCRWIMTHYKVEKVPIFYNNTGNVEQPIADQFYGLVTERSVQHYFNNQSMACLDGKGRIQVGAAVGIKQGFLEHVDALVAVNVDLICIDVANGHNIYTLDAVKAIRAKYPDLVIMAGNVCTLDGYKRMADAGVDCVRIGIGNGSICTTRLETGIGYGQWSALRECANYIFSSESRVSLPKLICDGGTLGKTGNKAKALAVGASAIIMGRTLASCEESPGQIIIRNGKRMKYFRGMASTMANLSKQEQQSMEPENKKGKLETEFTAEGVDGVVELKGSVVDIINQTVGGIKSGLSYLGSANIEELHGKYFEIEWALSTSIGQSETNTRVATF